MCAALLGSCTSPADKVSVNACTKILHNGIVLPEQWPPQMLDDGVRREMPLPYIEHKPAVIPINVGRQLCHDGYKKDDIEKLLVQAQHQVAVCKRDNAISESKAGLWIGPAIILVSLIWWYIASLIGYTIVLWHIIPVEFIGFFLGAVITIISPIRLIWYSIKNIKKKS